MFKFVVLCALIGAAVAEPDPGLVSSYAFPSAVVASAPQYIPNTYSNFVYSSPLVQPSTYAYSAPLTHLIKKRSLVLSPSPLATTYAAAPYATAYSAISPLTTSYAATIPTTYSSPFYTTTAHLIKKRAAPLIVPSTYSYVAPTTYAATAPVYASSIGAASYISTPYVSSLPLAYTAPLIKK